MYMVPSGPITGPVFVEGAGGPGEAGDMWPWPLLLNPRDAMLGASDCLLTVSLSDLLRPIKKNRPAARAMINTAPTTMPAIAPAGNDDFLLASADGVADV